MTQPFFSQQACSVVPYMAGGALVGGRKRHRCHVFVEGGELVIVGSDGAALDRSPVPSIEVDTPAFQRALGMSTFVRMNGSRWAIDFGSRGPRRGRAANRDLLAALMGAGAVNRRAKNQG